MPSLEQGFGAVNRFLRARAEDYAEEPQRLLDEAFRSVGATQALGYTGHMYTELRAVGPTLSQMHFLAPCTRTKTHGICVWRGA